MLPIAVLLGITVIAVIVAGVAVWQARAARAALRASESGAVAATRRETDAVVPVPAAPRAGGAEGGAPARSRRILVVEDEPGVREFISRSLTRAGRDAVAVAGPLAALAALNRQPIALMLVDIVMPEMNGYDLADEARKIAPGIQVVFMSAFARDAIRHPDAGRFLTKPFTSQALIAMVDEALAP
ncbi:MAG: response regulator [Vicinamibacterales bacterium]|jgi:CheY-like chemotaxis protein